MHPYTCRNIEIKIKKKDLTDYNVEDLTVYDIVKICFKTTKDSCV